MIDAKDHATLAGQRQAGPATATVGRTPGLCRRDLLGAGMVMASVASAVSPPGARAAELDHGPDRLSEARLSEAAVAENQAFFPGFRQSFIATQGVDVDGKRASGATINTLVGGKGPPLLLIHGHPETHVTWHKVAGRLAERFTVVLTDLRGYGDSSKPAGGPDHIDYSKRAMGADQVQVMRALGFDTFQAVGHDRGGRVLHFMMIDHPEAVVRAAVLDIAPTDLMYQQTSKTFATKYFWWFFQIQQAPVPERFIGALTDYYLEDHLTVQSKTPGAVTPAAYAAYLRTYKEPAAIHAVCEDYRAAAGIDSALLEADRKAGRKVATPLLALWGAKGTVGELFDVVGMWQQEAADVSGQALPCGHLIPEEDPDGLLGALGRFLTTA